MNDNNYFNTARLFGAPLVLGLIHVNAIAAPQYSLIDLGTLEGQFSQGFNVNDDGKVATLAYTLGNQAVRGGLGLSNGTMTNLNTLGGSRSQALDINIKGELSGTADMPNDAASHAFIYGVAGMTDLGTLGGSNSRGMGINDNGAVTGASQITGNAAEHAFLYSNGVRTDLGTLGGSNSQGNDVNTAGQVTGYANLAGNTSFHAFRRTGATLLDLGTLGGSYSEGLRINAAGTVTGYATLAGNLQHHAALWVSGSAIRDLGTLGGTMSAGYGINTAGNVVGYATNAADALRRAFVWKGTTMQDLNTLILPNQGWVLTDAYGISDNGNITGLGTLTKTDFVNNTTSVEQHAFLLVPDREAPVISSCPAAISTNGTQPLSIGSAIATDNLDPAPVISNNRPASFPAGSTTVTWTARDASGNQSNCTQRVTIIVDTTPPVVTPQWTPPTADGLNGWYTTNPVSLQWLVSDAESTVSAKTGCLDTAVADTLGQTLTCAATSQGGTSPVVSTSVKVDSAAPMMTSPAAVTATLNGAPTVAVNYTTPTASDPIPGSGINAANVSCSPASASAFARGSNTVNCSVSDNAGNQTSASFNVTVNDVTAPVISPVITGTLGTNGWYRSAANLSWTVTDLESPETLVKTCAGLSVPTDNPSSSDTCTASSAGGVATAVTSTLKVDLTAPTLTPPAAITAEASASSGASVTLPATIASDLTSGLAGAVSCSRTSGLFALGTSTVTCSVNDNAGNTGNTSYNVTVRDTTRPTLSLPANMVVVTGKATGDTVSYTATATDTVSGLRPVTCSPLSAANFPVGITTVNCSASDEANNMVSGSFAVTVNLDNVAPVITVPANIVTTATNASGVVVNYAAATATDAVSGARPVSCSPLSASVFPVGATIVNCSASDAVGNTATKSFTVTVNPADTTPPVITVPANIVTTATNASGAVVTYAASATDAVSGTRVVSCSPASGATFAVTTTTVNCSASDAVGNTATKSFTVTVNPADTTPPVITVPANIVTTATNASGAVVTYAASATDAVSGTRVVSCSPASGATFAVTTTTVNCSASDAVGNTATKSFTVTVNPADTTPPVITVPANIVTTATNASGAVVTYAASATDAVSGTRVVSCSPASGATFAVTTTTVNCSASDAVGNTATKSFTVTVNPLASAADLAISGTATGTLTRGSTLSYTFTVKNTGTAAANAVTFTDALPTALRFSSLITTPAATCTQPSVGSTGTIRCNFGSLAANATATVVVRARINTAGAIANTGVLTSTSTDSDPTNNSATVNISAR